jgi:hypothetical protein
LFIVRSTLFCHITTVGASLLFSPQKTLFFTLYAQEL